MKTLTDMNYFIQVLRSIGVSWNQLPVFELRDTREWWHEPFPTISPGDMSTSLMRGRDRFGGRFLLVRVHIAPHERKGCLQVIYLRECKDPDSEHAPVSTTLTKDHDHGLFITVSLKPYPQERFRRLLCGEDVGVVVSRDKWLYGENLKTPPHARNVRQGHVLVSWEEGSMVLA